MIIVAQPGTTPEVPVQDGLSVSGFPPGTPICAWPLILNGFPLGRVDDFGLEWIVSQVTGWESSASSGGDQTERVSDHGATAPEWFSRAKEISISGQLEAFTPEQRFEAESRLKRVIGGRDVPLVVQEEVERTTLVRLNGIVNTARQSTTRFLFEVPLLALDPRLYSTTPRTLRAPVPTSSTRFTVPLAVPFGIGSSSVTREALNAGTETAWPVWRLVGPMSAPVLSNPATGERLTLLERDGSPFVIAQGQSIVIDTAPSARTILLATSDFPDGDQSLSRKYAKVGDFWGFGPGSTRVEMSATSPVDVTPGQFMATWADTWL